MRSGTTAGARWLARLALAVQITAVAAAQNVLTVDDDPGAAQYQSIGAALTHADVGDRIEVAAGSYPGFTVWRGVTIMGADPSTVRVDGAVTVNHVPPGETVVLADFEVSGPVADLAFRDCAGTVLVDRVGGVRLEVLDCDDVRFQVCTLDGGAYVRFSTAQFVSSVVAGAPGSGSTPDGGRALLVQHARVAISGSSIRGGDGAPAAPPPGLAGNGGDAINVLGPTSRLWLLDSDALGGAAGPGATVGFGLAVSNGEAVTARATVTSAVSGPPPALIRDAPDFPSLEWLGSDMTPGGIVTLSCRAGAGDGASIHAGREPRVEPSAVELPWFHSRDRGAPLGALPAHGTALVPFTIPPLQRGTLVFGQFARVTAGGDRQLSNGATLVVR